MEARYCYPAKTEPAAPFEFVYLLRATCASNRRAPAGQLQGSDMTLKGSDVDTSKAAATPETPSESMGAAKRFRIWVVAGSGVAAAFDVSTSLPLRVMSDP